MFSSGNGNGKGLASLYDPDQATGRAHDDALRDTVANEVIDQINREFPVKCCARPPTADRQRIQERINPWWGWPSGGITPTPATRRIASSPRNWVARLMGLGFLDLLLPPARTDLSEICVYSTGLVQVMKKNSVRWETVPDLHPEPAEINRVLDRLLGPQNKSLNEANPTINAKLPATPAQSRRRAGESAAPGHRPARAQPQHQHPPVRAETGPAGVDRGARR